MKKQTIFLLFSTAAFMLALVIAVMNPEKAEGEESSMIETRQKFFGKENVDLVTGDINKDKVILSWIGVSNFAAAINGHVILLDSWIPGGDKSNYVPATVKELIDLKPEALFLGHAHFDHSDNAATILEQTDAVLVGTPEHCELVKKDAKNPEGISCIPAVEQGAKPGNMNKLDFLDGVSVTALAHIHLAAKLPDLTDRSHGIFLKKDLKSNAPKVDLKKLLGAIGNDGGGMLMYQFQVGDFVLTWNDTAGPVKEDTPELIGIMSSLPQTDVQVGAIMGFNQYFNGLRDPRMLYGGIETKAVHPDTP